MRPIRAIRWILPAIWLALAPARMGRAPAEPPAPPPRAATPDPSQPKGYTGSETCRRCHERFYKLWSTSHHGLAMQPFTADLARTKLAGHREDIEVGKHRYRFELRQGAGWVRQRGPDGQATYRVEHAMGGKNVYYFLTPLQRGRLQVLPVAFDVRRKEWIDTTASMVRHAAGRRDEALHWRDPLLTFNTSCHACHVSQLSTNYDLKTDTYRTTWREPGINCETCHGPAGEHVRAFTEAPPDRPPKDLKLISYKGFTVEQTNTTCAPCHAKMAPLTSTFQPGQRYFDHYDLVTLEDPDFHPDGRDLGENYTHTLWLTSPCARSGKLSCTHCHTSSGRYRFAEPEVANNACMPCHKERVAGAAAHTHHKADSAASRCISCHMPQTAFARMRRSDHSMRPPTPAATVRFKSPNACNLCHTKADEDAAWADRHVRAWHKRDYQAPVLARAGLVAAARKRDFTRLPEMLDHLSDTDEIYATSLIRLLARCTDPRKWPALRKAMRHDSPLVRSAAAAGLGANLTPQNRDALLRATADGYRIVRIRAARALSPYPRQMLNAADQRRLRLASEEFRASLECRPDDWASHCNLGNYHLDRGDPTQALRSFQVAARLRPDAVAPLVNASIVHARMGRTDLAEKALQDALRIDPPSAEANFNLGLLKAEQSDLPAAEKHLRAALKTDPELADAAHNLGVLLSRDPKGAGRMTEAIRWCRKAAALCPDQPKYAYTLAFYLNQSGGADEAISTLRKLIDRHPAYADAWVMLGSIYEKQGKTDQAWALYRRGATHGELPARARAYLDARSRALPPR